MAEEQSSKELLLVCVAGKNKDNRWVGLYRCFCGAEFKTQMSSVERGLTKSCGCLRKKATIERNVARTVHGKTDTPEHTAWYHMKDRCSNPKNNRYHRYGGRGIVVCPEWQDDFEQFLKDMGPRPSEKHSLERDDTDGNYEPSNCRWATEEEQANNTSTNHMIPYQGRVQSIARWARELGFTKEVLYCRLLNYKWPVEKAFTQPVRKWSKKE